MFYRFKYNGQYSIILNGNSNGNQDLHTFKDIVKLTNNIYGVFGENFKNPPTNPIIFKTLDKNMEIYNHRGTYYYEIHRDLLLRYFKSIEFNNQLWDLIND